MGETHSNNTLCFDAFELGTLSAHKAQGIYAFPSLVTTGFGFGSHGEVAMEVEPSVLEPLGWSSRGEQVESGARLCATNMAPEALERASILIGQNLQENGLGDDVTIHEVHGKETGASVTFFAQFERGVGTGSAMMQRGMTINQTISRAWENFEKWYQTKATVDTFLADQILIPACLCESKSVFTIPEVTRRLTTMAWVIKQFLPIHITILGREGEPGTVTVEW
jgi:RNA 3'-terminal phosphate cyclase (ATP)